MKSVLILVLAIFLSSCCSTKKAIETQPELAKEVVNINSDPIIIYINTYVNNYAPLEIENYITKPIESIITLDDNVIKINSISESEYSKISVFFNTNINSEEALEIVQNKINELIANNRFPNIENQKIKPNISIQNNFDIKHNAIKETKPELAKEVAVVTEVPEPPKTEKINDSIHFIEIAKHDEWDKLLKKYVSESGKVDYKGFKKDKSKLHKYINYLKDNQPAKAWMKNQKLAYWINAYNALTIDLIIRNYPLESIKDIKDPWDQRLWKFGDKWQNLNDIEHKILRKMDEPRIHFAIVCASESCPKLQNSAFTVANLEAQLTNATKEFLDDTSKNELSQNNIKLSKIFKWFKKDFEVDGSLIDFLNQYTEVSISESAKKSYKDYNWDLND